MMHGSKGERKSCGGGGATLDGNSQVQLKQLSR